MTIPNLSARQLRQAAALRERIDALERRLGTLLNAVGSAPQGARPGRTSSAGAPARRRSAKVRRPASKAARARMAAAAKARWARAKAAGKNTLKVAR